MSDEEPVLIPHKYVVDVYRDEINGLYDDTKLDNVLLHFYERFKWYATHGIFVRKDEDNSKFNNERVRGSYRVHQKQCEHAIKNKDCRKKMLVIDTLISMEHQCGLFGMKLIKNFNEFKEIIMTGDKNAFSDH